MTQRLAGQDTSIFVVVDKIPIDEITAVKTYDVTWKFKSTSEEYVGEGSPRKDDFFEGMSGQIEYDGETTAGLTLIEAFKTRAQNRAITTKIGIKTTLNMADGRAIINIPDVRAGGDIKMSVPSRSDYVKFTLPWEADDGRIISR